MKNTYSMRKGCTGQVEIAILPHFLAIQLHVVRKGCTGQVEIAILPHFLAIQLHVVRKGCAGRLGNRNFISGFWRSNLISCERVVPDDLEIAILFQVLAIEPHFVRKGCVSCRLVGTAPRLQERNRKEGEGKRARGEDVKM